MAELKSADYNTPACESHVGNLNVDVMKHVITGNEAVGDVVKLRLKNEYNSYLRAKLICSEAMAALSTVDVGYLGKAGAADAPNVLGDDLDVAGTLVHDLITGVPIEPGVAHELCITLNTDFAADAGKVLTLVAEFVATSG